MIPNLNVSLSWMMNYVIFIVRFPTNVSKVDLHILYICAVLSWKQVNYTSYRLARLSLGIYVISGQYAFFVCFGVFVPLENFHLLKRHHFRWRATNFDLYAEIMVIEQWGFFNVPHLLWHGPTLCYGHLRGPVTLRPVAERLKVESLPVLKT